MKILILILLLSLTTQATSSTSEGVCPRKLLAIENIQISQDTLGASKVCFLSLHPRDAFETLVYRDYLLTSEGLLMVFNSLSPNEGSQSSGAREFYFFKTPFVGFEWEVLGNQLVVKGLANLKIHFSLMTAQITKIENSVVKVDPQVNANNAGGFEILQSEWTFLDTGFFFGNLASSQPNRISTLKNKDQKICRLRNRNLFDYDGQNASLKSFEAVEKLTLQSCPNFKL